MSPVLAFPSHELPLGGDVSVFSAQVLDIFFQVISTHLCFCVSNVEFKKFYSII